MRIASYIELRVAKAGNGLDKCEDRAQGPKSINRSKPKFRFAIADGATEGAFSGLWAEKLVDAFVRRYPTERKIFTLDKMLTIAAQEALRWSKEVWAKPLGWAAQEKLAKGAFSTLTGIFLENDPASSDKGYWSSLSVGDSCVFQVREDALITCFPLESAADFNNRPFLLATDPANNAVLREQADGYTASGSWQAGDRFLLMTDALAQWFFTQVEREGKPWLTELAQDAFDIDASRFDAWIDELRAGREIRNDDVTLLMFEVQG